MNSRQHKNPRRSNRLAVELLEPRENPNGTVVAALSAGGALYLNGDALDNDFRIQLTGAGAVITGLNGTQIKANGGIGAAATLDGSVKSIISNCGAGSDHVSIDAIAAFALTGHATFNLGAGNNSIDLVTAGPLSIGGNLRVIGGIGTDTVNVRGGIGNPGVVGGGVGIALGHGGSSVDFENLSINGRAGLGIGAGNGIDTVNLNNVSITASGALIVGGPDQLNVDLNGAISIEGRLAIGGAGGVDVDVAGGSFGAFLVAGGILANTDVNIAGVTNVATDLVVRGTNAALNADAALTVGRHLSIGARADATLEATGSSLDIGRHVSVIAGRKAMVNFATSDSADIGGNLGVLGGFDGDSITADADLTVNGNLGLLLRGGNNSVSLGTSGDLDVNGNLVVLVGTGNDDVTLTQVKVDGNTVIRLGAGIDSVIVKNGSEFRGATFVDLGAGSDILSVATDVLASAGVTFHGRTILWTGLDNDVINLGTALIAGGTLNTNATFLAAGNIFNAGLGVDLFVQANAQIIGALGVFGVP